MRLFSNLFSSKPLSQFLQEMKPFAVEKVSMRKIKKVFRKNLISCLTDFQPVAVFRFFFV